MPIIPKFPLEMIVSTVLPVLVVARSTNDPGCGSLEASDDGKLRGIENTKEQRSLGTFDKSCQEVF